MPEPMHRCAVLIRHDQIADNHVRMIAPEALAGFLRRGRGADDGAVLLEARAHELAVLGVVVDDEDRQAPQERRRFDGRCAIGNGRAVGARRQPYLEFGALIRSGAVRRDRAAVLLHEVPRDGQTEAEAAVLPRGSRIALAELLEQLMHGPRLKADARIADDDLERVRG